MSDPEDNIQPDHNEISHKLLVEAIELLKFRVDPRHSRRPEASDIRDWIQRCHQHLQTASKGQ